MKTSKKEPQNQLAKESKLVSLLLWMTLISVASGIAISVFGSRFDNWLQWNLIGHSLISFVLLAPLAIYIVVHFRRTVGIRKPAILFTGLLTALLLFGLFGSGIWITTIGHKEALEFISASHKFLAYFAITLTAAHILLHWLSRRNKRKVTNTVFIAAPSDSYRKTMALSFSAYLLLIAVLTIAYSVVSTDDSQPIGDDYDRTYGDHPFKPSLTETDHGEFVQLSQIAKSEQCGECHTQIFDEWKSSAHRQAASDPAYVKNINLLADSKGIAATRYCEGCHAPVALLTGELTTGGKHGGIPNTPAHIEGVGCMGCHGIESVHNLDGTASYLFSAKESYLFGSSKHYLGQKIRNFLIQSKPDKHKANMGAEILGDPKLCASCHEQFMDKSMNNWGWVKMQSTYKEWLASPFSGQADENHNADTSMRCQDCHFQKVDSQDPSSDIFGKASSHRSLGANTVFAILKW